LSKWDYKALEPNSDIIDERWHARKNKISTLIILFSLIIGSVNIPLSKSNPFLSQENGILKLNEKDFKFYGVNSYDIIRAFVGPNIENQNGTRILMVSNLSGIKVIRYNSLSWGSDLVRYWLNNKTQFWEEYDTFIDLTKQYNISLIPVL